jgi:hypothetical protein
MRTTITTAAIACTAFFLAPAAVASELPARKVQINTERLAALPPAEQLRVLEIQDRLQAILATDRAALDAGQRTELRGEWKELKSEMKYYNRNGGVIYISTAALIIIILLLIILL